MQNAKLSHRLISIVREVREFKEFKEFKETFRYLNHSYHPTTQKSCIIEGILGGGVLSEARILCVCKREQNFSNAKFTDYTAFFTKSRLLIRLRATSSTYPKEDRR